MDLKSGVRVRYTPEQVECVLKTIKSTCDYKYGDHICIMQAANETPQSMSAVIDQEVNAVRTFD